MPNRWCNSAELRRMQIESGLDITFNEIFRPIFIERISSLNPLSILEVGAGTGHLSKKLSEMNYNITAIEPSEGMYKVANDVLNGSNVTLLNISSFDLVKSEKFDVAFSHMVAHVVDDVTDFFRSIYDHMNLDSHFLFSIPHPCFYNDYKKFFGSEYSYMKSIMKNVSFNISKDKDNKITGVPYHHRPISVYINNLVNVGFSIDSFNEIFPSTDIQEKYGSPWKTPRYCIFACKKL